MKTEKLKTHKDIFGENIITRDDCEACKALAEKIVLERREAIKWFWKIDKDELNGKWLDVDDFIIKFFNLTGKDLK